MTEEEFVGYFGKDIEITFANGDTLIGHVSSFTWADDNEENEASIALKSKKYPTGLIEVMQSEVKTIKVIND